MPPKKTDSQSQNNSPAEDGSTDAGASAAPRKRVSRKSAAEEAVQSAAKVAKKAVKKVASAIGDAVSELAEKKTRRKAAAGSAGAKESVGKAGALKKTPVKSQPTTSAAVESAAETTAAKPARSRKKGVEALVAGTESADVRALINDSVSSGAIEEDSAVPTEVRRHFVDDQSHAGPPPPAEHRELPDTYGDTKLVVLVRDPEWVYAYWEINDVVRQQFGLENNGHGRRMVLRFYKVTGRQWPVDAAEYFFDVDISPYAANWYIKVPEVNQHWVAELGFFDQANAFVSVCRSNPVVTPRDSISEEVDSEWMTVEESFQKITMLAGGNLKSRLNGSDGVAPGSESVLRQLNRQISGMLVGERPAMSSGLFSSGSLLGRDERDSKGFWIDVHTELILYGATEPDARVTVQGQPVQLAADGTFSMRFALPDGEQVLTVTGVSADGEFEETITPVVKRSTR